MFVYFVKKGRDFQLPAMKIILYCALNNDFLQTVEILERKTCNVNNAKSFYGAVFDKYEAQNSK